MSRISNAESSLDSSLCTASTFLCFPNIGIAKSTPNGPRCQVVISTDELFFNDLWCGHRDALDATLGEGIFNQTSDLAGAAIMTRRCGILSAVRMGGTVAASCELICDGGFHAVSRLTRATYHEDAALQSRNQKKDSESDS